MKKEAKKIKYDNILQIEAYCFHGAAQVFPNHFHDYYAIGYIQNGKRRLSCKNREYVLSAGDMVIFNPGDNHSCVQMGDTALDYLCINISKEVMIELAREITGENKLPEFYPNVIADDDISRYLYSLHGMIMGDYGKFIKEEAFLLLMSMLISRYGQHPQDHVAHCRDAIEKACLFMDSHFAERISLEQLCRIAGLSKSSLLRTFTVSKGVTPYNYLQSVRIDNAKRLLESGYSPADAALKTGFSDQSHFTNYFTRFIGISPGMYREIFSKKQSKEEISHGK